MARKNHHQAKGPFQHGHGARHGLFRAEALIQEIGDQMRDDFGVGFTGIDDILIGQPLPQFLIILDNAIMDDGNAIRRMGMGIPL